MPTAGKLTTRITLKCAKISTRNYTSQTSKIKGQQAKTVMNQTQKKTGA
jgi:hypothetical protein